MPLPKLFDSSRTLPIPASPVNGTARAHDRAVQTLDRHALASVTGGVDPELDQCKLLDGTLANAAPGGSGLAGPSYASSAALQYNFLNCRARLQANGTLPRAPLG